jgi:hypothetical protein
MYEDIRGDRLQDMLGFFDNYNYLSAHQMMLIKAIKKEDEANNRRELEEVIVEFKHATQQLIPIFAMTPTSTEEIYRNVVQSSTVEQPLIIQYDRLMRFRPTPFYGHKREQLIYYLYSTSIANVNNANIVISQLLDREDAAAQDVNDWARANPDRLNVPHNVYFHNIRVYQADETRDLIDLASARTVFTNKLIIEYDYHPVWGRDKEGNPIDQDSFK